MPESNCFIRKILGRYLLGARDNYSDFFQIVEGFAT